MHDIGGLDTSMTSVLGENKGLWAVAQAGMSLAMHAASRCFGEIKFTL